MSETRGPSPSPPSRGCRDASAARPAALGGPGGVSPWLGHTATFLGPSCLHPVTPWVTPGRAQVTSEEELQVGVQVTAARSLGQAQEPPECGLEGLLQHLGGQSGAAGSSRPPRPRPPGVSLPCPGVRVGTRCRGTAHWASFLQGRSVEQLQHGPPSRGARRPPSSGASASGRGEGGTSAPDTGSCPERLSLKAPGTSRPCVQLSP